VVVDGRSFLTFFGRRVLDDHCAGRGRCHAKHAPEECLERRVYIYERLVLLGLITSDRVDARHARVVLVKSAKARGERHYDYAEHGSQPGKVCGHFSQGHLQWAQRVAELAQKQQP